MRRRAWVFAAAAVVPWLGTVARAQPVDGAPASASASAPASTPAFASAPASASAPGSASAPAPAPAPVATTPPPPVDDVEEAGKLGVHYQLEAIRIRGNTRTRERTILRYVPFRPGDEIDLDDSRLELVRYRLLGTGFFSDVQLSLSRGSKRGSVHLDIDVIERNTIVINDVWLGLSADATPEGTSRPLTAYGGVDVAETNFYGTGVTLGGAMAVADRQSAYRLRFADPSFLGSKWIVTGTLVFNDARDFFGTRDVLFDPPKGDPEKTDYAVMQYRRRGGALGLGYDLSTSLRLLASYHLEAIDASMPRAASHRRGLDIEPIEFHLLQGRSLLSYVSILLEDDTRDDPVLPSRGHHVQIGGDIGLNSLGSDYGFLRAQIRGSRWWPVGARDHVFRIDAFAGALVGDAPLFMRFYIGDFSDFLPDRVLDLAFDRRPSPNFLRTSVVETRYEEFATRVVAEYRIPLHRSHRSVYGVDLFASAGFFALASARDVSSPARGYSGLARLPVDLTFNLGVRVSTKAGGFVLAIANPIGFFPIRSEGVR
ncbi:MAG: BamA/TamA family outer membrane protein [Deltaproteobacteria bacterium]|nr:BamA/TamA family outer membrane protein [Deltaproteobacteria bacterium]